MDALEPKLRDLLAKQPAGAFALDGNGNKLTCSINGHSLPARFDAVSAFVNGAKYQKLLRRHQAESALKKYEPFIVQSANFPLMLYCALTGQLMDKSVEAVKQHMQGKKFQRAKERFTSDELELKPEPTLESFGVRLPKKGGDGEEGEEGEQQQQEGGRGEEEEAGGDGFWVPVGEDGSGSGSDGEEEDEEGGSSSGLMEEDGADPSASPAAAAAAADAAMDEDGAANGAAPKQKKHKKQKQQPAKEKKPQQTKHGATNGAAAAPGAEMKKAKKVNANKPSAAKRAKR